MRWTILGVVLWAATAIAADAGALDGVAARDAGRTEKDAGAADAGTSAALKVKPLFILAESDLPLDKFAVARPADRAAIKGLLSKVTIGKRAAAAIFVEGYELPRSRRVDLSADIVITDPTGREVVDKASVANAQTMDPKNMKVVPLKPVVGLMFGLTDPEGEYQVRITVWDHVRGDSSSLETKFTVTR